MTEQEIQIQQGARILEFCKFLNIKGNRLAKELGISQSNVSMMTSGTRRVTLEFLKKITNRYPQLSVDWILNGEGPMLKEETVVKNYQIETDEFQLVNEPGMDDVERLRNDVVRKYKSKLTVKQDLALRQACYKVMVDNAGAPWAALVVGAGVYLRFIEAYPSLQIPEGRVEDTGSPGAP